MQLHFMQRNVTVFNTNKAQLHLLQRNTAVFNTINLTQRNPFTFDTIQYNCIQSIGHSPNHSIS